MQYQTGLNTSFIGQLYGNPAPVPAAAGATPQGPRTIGQQSFGIVGGDSGGGTVPFWATVGGGIVALTGLAFLWWALPR